jgi:MYXO-CTERM domain-containing protein
VKIAASTLAPAILALVAPGAASGADPLPEGDVGIASHYDGDAGIEADPEVIFFDDFEDYVEASDLDASWESVHHYDQIRFATEGDDVFAGAQSLQFTVPQQNEELSNGTTKWVSPELDALFLRYYTKFDAPYDVVGSSHNGSMISAHYYMGHQATPGVPADGTNKWLVNLENWRGEASTPSPGLTNVYVYHPEQRDVYGDHFFPTGLVMPNTSLPYDFGPDFVPRDEFIPELQRWYCWELMVQANTPGERDGRIAAWIDGVLVADWQNLRLRDVPDLTIDRFGIGFHIGSNPNGETHKWYDNVVAARAYIGPLGDGMGGGESGSSEGSGSGPEPSGGGEGEASGEAEAGSAGGDGSATGGGDAGGTASTGEGTESGAGGANDEGDGGCGCSTRSRVPAVWLGLFLLVFGGARRRRG